MCISLHVVSLCAVIIRMRHLGLKVADSVHTVVIGNSHTECAINDALLPGVINLSWSGTGPFLSYLKAKQLIKDNPHIKNVIFGCAPLDLQLFSGNPGLEYWSRYYVYADKEDYQEILRIDASILFDCSIRPYLKYLVRDRNYLQELGRYYYLDRDKLQENIDRRKIKDSLHFEKDSLHFDRYYAELNLIKDLCEVNNLDLILLSTPHYKGDIYYSSAYTEYNKNLKMMYSDLTILDFTDIILPDSCYGDIHHLNYKGANIFTPILLDTLTNLGLYKE